jgi:hypothetical protein
MNVSKSQFMQPRTASVGKHTWVLDPGNLPELGKEMQWKPISSSALRPR